MTIDRRSFLKRAGASALAASSLGTLASSVASMPALGASTDGYKALVCVFFFGGLDCHDTVLPFDQSSYNSYSSVRGSFLSRYSGGRDRSNLLALSPDNTSTLSGRQFALPPQMTGLQSLFQNGEMAIVGNVGPLIEPVTKAQVESGGGRLPPKLFSHNDQQSTWQASAPEGAQYGWGGLFADAALASGANGNADASVFTTITSGGNQLYLTGENAAPYQVSPFGASSIELLEYYGYKRDSSRGEEVYQLLRSHLRGNTYGGSSMIKRDIAAAMQGSLDSNEKFSTARDDMVPISTQFPDNYLAQQLRAVAETISMRDTLLMNRQVFFVGIGGFDTHDNQAQDLASLHGEIDGALSAFNAAMKELGAHNDVTLFTASEFGRTLAINGDGTDHGWGGHQLVMGGAVQGRQILGNMPPAELDHEWDVGGGRLLPSLSVEQFAEPIGKWFGLSDNELLSAMPNLANFERNALSMF